MEWHSQTMGFKGSQYKYQISLITYHTETFSIHHCLWMCCYLINVYILNWHFFNYSFLGNDMQKLSKSWLICGDNWVTFGGAGHNSQTI